MSKYQRATTGVGNVDLIVNTPESKEVGTWSSGGRYLAYTQTDRKTNRDIWVAPLSGGRKPVPFLQTEFNEQDPAFSPDAKWMAYTSDKGGVNNVLRHRISGRRQSRVESCERRRRMASLAR